MRRNDFEGFGTWGDHAFVFDLNGDRKPEYFVPLDCGTTGNCTWGIFDDDPRLTPEARERATHERFFISKVERDGSGAQWVKVEFQLER